MFWVSRERDRGERDRVLELGFGDVEFELNLVAFFLFFSLSQLSPPCSTRVQAQHYLTDEAKHKDEEREIEREERERGERESKAEK